MAGSNLQGERSWAATQAVPTEAPKYLANPFDEVIFLERSERSLKRWSVAIRDPDTTMQGIWRMTLWTYR